MLLMKVNKHGDGDYLVGGALPRLPFSALMRCGKKQVQDLFTEDPPDLFGQLPDGQKIPAFGSPKAGMNR